MIKEVKELPEDIRKPSTDRKENDEIYRRS